MKLLCLFVLVAVVSSVHGQLPPRRLPPGIPKVPRVGFYDKTCPQAESIIRLVVGNYTLWDSSIAPGLVKLVYRDCFGGGCDASVLLRGLNTERASTQFFNTKIYDLIDDAKTQLEEECRGVVSCADILAIAARDAVVWSKGPYWQVPTGRRDGLRSYASSTTNLPGVTDSVASQLKKFTDKGLDLQDFVALVGAHTIGRSKCGSFSYRLYNFNNTGLPDPTIKSGIVLSHLRRQCPQDGSPVTRVDLDTGSPTLFDESYFENVKNGRGVLESDQKLFGDASTRNLVERYTYVKGAIFKAQFAKSMVKMTNIGVLTKPFMGEIRRSCSFANPR